MRALAGIGLSGLVLILCQANLTQSDKSEKEGLIARVDDLTGRLRTAENRIEKLQQEVSQLKDILDRSPPIGAVLAFAGTWPPQKSDGKAHWSEDELGWMLCDGRTFDAKKYPTLRQALGATTIPDYRGRFLRAIDCSIDGKTTTGADKEGIRRVGNNQGWATASPPLTPSASITATAAYLEGSYQQKGAAPADYVVLRNPKAGGAPNVDIPCSLTSFSLSGFGDETRPVNVAVYWIVRVR